MLVGSFSENCENYRKIYFPTLADMHLVVAADVPGVYPALDQGLGRGRLVPEVAPHDLGTREAELASLPRPQHRPRVQVQHLNTTARNEGPRRFHKPGESPF